MNSVHGVTDVVVARHGTWSTTRGEIFREPGEDRADEPFVIDYYLWAIIGETATILVDTGFSPKEAARRGRVAVRSPVEIFAALGVDERWSGDVVLTHLHYDHTGFVSALPNARFHISELEFAFRATADQEDAPVTSADDLARIDAAHREGRVVLHSTDGELAPGVELVLAPGHTPGELMLRVMTPYGPLVLASDVAHFDEEFEQDAMFRWMTHPADAVRSYARLRAMRDAGDEIVTGHEPGLIERYPEPPAPFGAETALIRPRRHPEETT
jgi:glyoxylase-like metal-dependent hydrolase (beta-lactamase superfamily II)